MGRLTAGELQAYARGVRARELVQVRQLQRLEFWVRTMGGDNEVRWPEIIGEDEDEVIVDDGAAQAEMHKEAAAWYAAHLPEADDDEEILDIDEDEVEEGGSP